MEIRLLNIHLYSPIIIENNNKQKQEKKTLLLLSQRSKAIFRGRPSTAYEESSFWRCL